MVKSSFVVVLVFVILFGLFSSTSATPIAKVVTGVVSNAVSALLKWMWSLKSTTKPGKVNQFSVQYSRSMIKLESGYTVETIFDGSKLGIEPHSVEVSPNGEFLVLDSENSNIYKIPSPVSRYNRPKILAGSPEGYNGHIDGRPREARMNHPKGLAVDDKGNIYIADTMNMAIRKISDEGVTTIAGGKRGQLGGHVDGPGEDAKFSNDFDVVYAGSTCSLLVVDRGNLAIREIQLHHHDCTTYHKQDDDDDDDDDVSFHLGIAVLVAAGFFGYMLALLHWRIRAMFSSHDDTRVYNTRKGTPVPVAAQQRPPKSVRPPLIPSEEEYEKEAEGFFGSIGRLFVYSGSAFAEIFGSLFSGGSKSKRKALHYQIQQQYQQQMNRHPNGWPMQESFVIPDEDEPPCLETRTPTPRETYPFMNQKDMDKPPQPHLNPGRGAYLSNSRWDGEYDQQIQQQRKHQLHKHYSSNPQTYYEQNCETNEIVFGAVQEQDGRRETMVIKAVDYGDPKYNHHNLRPRLNYVGYSHGY